MKRFFILSFIGTVLSVGFSGLSWADDQVVELPAGGVYVLQAKDKITFVCTADPIIPTLLSSSCGCFGTSGYRPFTLKRTVIFSNGKVVHSEVTNADSQAECEAKLDKRYADLCKNV